MNTQLPRITRNTPDEARHMNNLVLALVLTASIDKIYSHSVSISLETNFGIVADWHDTASALDSLANNGKIIRAGVNNNGNAVYTLKGN